MKSVERHGAGLSETCIGHPDFPADAIASCFDRDIFGACFPMTDSASYIINLTDLVSVRPDEVLIEGRYFRCPEVVRGPMRRTRQNGYRTSSHTFPMLGDSESKR
jgi:hypothetical protein